MVRNLRRRVETCFPLLEPELKAVITECLKTYLEHGDGAWILEPDGSYRRAESENGAVTESAQTNLLKTWGDI